MPKNVKCLKNNITVKIQIILFVTPLCLVVVGRGKVDGGLNSIFGHIFTNIYSKSITGFYFTIISLTLPAFTMQADLIISPLRSDIVVPNRSI